MHEFVGTCPAFGGVFAAGGAPNSLSDLGVICGPFKLHGEELSADDLLLDLSFRAEVPENAGDCPSPSHSAVLLGKHLDTPP